MSESKAIDLKQFEGHTPGPWRHDKMFPHCIWAADVWIASTNVETVAELEKREANACLMAAAPQLLAQLAAKDAVILGLKKALKRLERVVTELYPGDGEPDEEHIEEYRAVWSAILDAQNALALAAPKEGR